ncbi:OLC1v1010227C1 [Oldenlandia corymbosa var. corymbosa]|uniref:OLC1v1010227C1 n=1 Tax=Oldenlandia corymbosa var. corymbosa TaxID=529605 RepID=A0AAV1DTU8_OLDCO|nr:OLC1v1010227C1 [Oldenlandia corymbosa var. corymbosa]
MSVVEPGTVDVVLSGQCVGKRIHEMLLNGIESWATKLFVKRAVVEFWSPIIVTELDIRHLRSIVIGDTLARLLEFCNVEVLRRSNVERVKKVVAKLRRGDEKYRKVWAHICKTNRKGYEKIYKRLGILLEEDGESFRFDNPCLSKKKQNGLYTLLILLRRIISKIENVFSVARSVGWLPPSSEDKYPKVNIATFGDGSKFRKRSNEVGKVIDLIEGAKTRCKGAMGWNLDELELEQTAEAVGYGAVKYDNLMHNRSKRVHIEQ